MICLDGIIYSLQRNGGVTVYFDTLIQEMDRSRLDYKLITHADKFQGSHVCKRRARIFERYRSVKTPMDARVFLSSYYRCAINPDVPMVTTVHDFVYEAMLSGPKAWIHRAQKFTAIERSTDIICVSEATRRDMYRFFGHPKARVHVIHNGVSDEFFPLTKIDHSNFLLYVGNRRGYKNFELLKRALPLLPNFDLVCVGGEEWTNDEKDVVASMLKGKLRIERGVSVSRLNELYNSAICLVYPSLYEGFGIPALEAMRAGCPVVSANCAAVKEAGGSALLVSENNSPGELAEQIGRCVTSERSSLVQVGIAQAHKFSWAKTHAETVNVLSRHL